MPIEPNILRESQFDNEPLNFTFELVSRICVNTSCPRSQLIYIFSVDMLLDVSEVLDVLPARRVQNYLELRHELTIVVSLNLHENVGCVSAVGTDN